MKAKFKKQGVPSKLLGKNKQKQNVDQKITTTKNKEEMVKQYQKLT